MKEIRRQTFIIDALHRENKELVHKVRMLRAQASFEFSKARHKGRLLGLA